LSQPRIPAQLREGAVDGFARTFEGKRPEALGVAPGRAEILGNHTDYNEGFILAAAIDRYVVIAGRRTDGSTCRVASAFFPGQVVTFSADSPEKKAGPEKWANYVAGVVSELAKLGLQVTGFDAFMVSDIPSGAGMSSSAAVEMATAKLLAFLFPSTVGKLADMDIIQVAKAAENNFVGMGCGILDQFTSGKGRAGHVVFLDCRSLYFKYAPFKGAQFVLANTNAPHALVDGKYDELRQHCFAVASIIKQESGNSNITHLRDVDSALLAEHAGRLSDAQRRRAQHIVTENERVHNAITALKAGDMVGIGQMLNASHASSRHDFGNSSKELDIMSECAEGIEGFLGARLMGGGFGGATLNLVREGYAEAFAAELERKYKAATQRTATTVIFVPGNGAFNVKAD
jgi:galactokinase